MKATFDLVTREPVILSETAATTGGHVTLDFVPGAVLFGLAAARFYERLSPEEAWTAFHSGELRFGTAFPVTGATREVCFPMPRALHRPKSGEGPVVNLARCERAQGQQYTMLSGFVSPSAEKHHVATQSTLKTAVDPRTGSAFDGQLFAYEAIAPDQTFRFTLEATSAAAAALLGKVADYLEGRGHRIGRSRSAEFGAVEITRTDVPTTITDPTPISGQVAIWCLTDLWLPELAEGRLPDGVRFGLVGGVLELKRSFIAYRRYAPFNGRWRQTDSERLVITAGSVLTYSGVASGLPSLQMVGLGLEAGLGLVDVGSALLAADEVAFSDRRAAQRGTGSSTAEMPALVKWADARRSAISQRRRDEDLVAALFEEWKTLVDMAAGSDGFRPSRSQWSAIAAVARASSSDLMDAVFDGDNPLIPPEDVAWSLRVDGDRALRNAVRGTFGAYGSRASDLAFVVEEAARRAAKHLAGELAPVGED